MGRIRVVRDVGRLRAQRVRTAPRYRHPLYTQHISLGKSSRQLLLLSVGGRGRPSL